VLEALLRIGALQMLILIAGGLQIHLSAQKRGKENVRIQEVQLHRELLQQGVHGKGRGRDARRPGIRGAGKGAWRQHEFSLRRREREVRQAYLLAGG